MTTPKSKDGSAPVMGADGPTVQDLIKQERQPVPDVLKDASSVFLGTEQIAKERYFDPAFMELELDKMWGRVWQMACREEDIPEIGDYEIYEIGSTSLLVTRSASDEIRAYYNVCLHRGRMLREVSGHAEEFRCPFHGFTWGVDGRCQKITNEWDFQHIDKAEYNLPQARVGRWGGFVFVNLDDDVEPLETYLEDIPEIYQTRDWPLEDRLKVVHVQKTNPCNWKVALEAFIESFHVVATHPGAMPYLGDAFTQYDIWPGKRHFSRMISPRGMHSPHHDPISDDEVLRAGIGPADPEAAKTATVPEGQTARQALADHRRAFLKASFGLDVDHVSDTELVDTIQYHIFPNLVCWAGYGSFLVYRFRPNGTDVDSSIMDIFFLLPKVEGREMEVVRQPTKIGIEGSHHEAPQLGGYCAVFDEDTSNLRAIQKGLKSMKGKGIELGAYQENRIRFFHQTLDSYVNGDAE